MALCYRACLVRLVVRQVVCRLGPTNIGRAHARCLWSACTPLAALEGAGHVVSNTAAIGHWATSSRPVHALPRSRVQANIRVLRISRD
jgi:hypothetical protein